MEPVHAETWHFVFACAAFLMLGGVGHVCRAVFNLFPDRLSDKPLMDMAVSDGYSLSDHLFGTEYDEAGYYRLDSWRNFRNASLFSAIGGMAVMIFSQGAADAIAGMIDGSVSWLWDLVLLRLREIELL